MVQENDGRWVRATQGHSVETVEDDQLLTKRTLDSQIREICAHGWHEARENGKHHDYWIDCRTSQEKRSKMIKKHVHFHPSCLAKQLMG